MATEQESGSPRRLAAVALVLASLAASLAIVVSTARPPEPKSPRLAFEASNGRFGFRDANGTVVIRPQYRYADDFSEGLAAVWRGSTIAFIDEVGQERFTLPQGAKSVTSLTEGCIWFCSEDDKWGICDRRGSVLLEPTYDDVQSFSGGLSAVNLGAKRIFPGILDGGKWGYVDPTGKVVVPLIYTYARDFHQGLAKAYADGETVFINRQGEEVFAVKQGLAGDFSDGLCPVTGYRMGATTTYLNRAGKVVFEVEGYGEEFSEGLAVVHTEPAPSPSTRPGVSYINTSGETVFQKRFLQGKSFSDGLAAVEVAEDQWGYINRSGRLVIPADFNEAEPFENGIAKAHRGGEFVSVEDADPFWTGGEWVMINKRGKVLGEIRDTTEDNAW